LFECIKCGDTFFEDELDSLYYGYDCYATCPSCGESTFFKVVVN